MGHKIRTLTVDQGGQAGDKGESSIVKEIERVQWHP